MNAEEARLRLAECLERLRGDVGYTPPDSWSVDALKLQLLPNGDWLAARPEMPSEGVILKSDGSHVPFFGALGKIVPDLGLPISREMFLGSTQLGRYQAYRSGLAIWETVELAGKRRDLGFPVVTWESADKRAKACRALVAFFDLRGFTKWSGSEVDAGRIQDVVERLELSFQDAFSRKWCQSLFAKSTGDGFMAVSEAGWHAVGGDVLSSGFQRGHVRAFCRACAETVRNARTRIPPELAIGCGITAGDVNQLYLLGRVDYIGPAVNDASKIQSVAYDELCVSPKISEYLELEGFTLGGKALPDKGTRCSPEVLLGAQL